VGDTRFATLLITKLKSRYNYSSPSHLISRLTSRNLHLLALRISNFLNVKADAVLRHWACAKILRSRPTTTSTGDNAELSADDEVCRMIVEKFEELGGVDVSYAEIAKKAWDVGRGGLATKVRYSDIEKNDILIALEYSFWIMSQRGLIKYLFCLR
jgi:vacuolar protein sorting-associated protein 16